jgi:predicted MFS family arabinose efflux permease
MPITNDKAQSAYRELLAVPGVRRLYLLSLCSRVPMGMIALLIVLVIQRATGGFSAAGAAVGAVAVGIGAISPLRARLVDRRGVRPVMVSSGVLHATALVLLWPMAEIGSPTIVLIINGLLVGATIPPTGIVMRAAWSRMLPDERRRRAAFTAESLAIQSTLLVGPVLVSAALLTIGPGWGLACCAGLTLPSALALGLSKRLQEVLRPVTGTQPQHWLGALRSKALLVSLPAGFGLFAAVNAMEITVTAQAVTESAAWAAGWLIAAFAIGGMLGGVAWGWRVWPGRPRTHLVLLQAVLAAAMFALAAGLPLPLTAVVLFAAGMTFPPAMTAQSSALDVAVPVDVLAESFGWMGAVRQAGTAVAGALAGTAIDGYGPPGGWIAGGAFAVFATLASIFLFPAPSPTGNGGTREVSVSGQKGMADE